MKAPRMSYLCFEKQIDHSPENVGKSRIFYFDWKQFYLLWFYLILNVRLIMTLGALNGCAGASLLVRNPFPKKLS